MGSSGVRLHRARLDQQPADGLALDADDDPGDEPA
jgi:hypothetical protein